MNKIIRRKRVYTFILAILILMGSFPMEVLASGAKLNNSEINLLRGEPTPTDYGPLKNVTHTLTLDQGHEELCKRTMTGELKFDWPEPSTYVDVVFVQDFSGSFDPTIAQVGEAVKTIVDSLNMGTDVDGVSPKDRAMIVSYQGHNRWGRINWNGNLYMSLRDGGGYAIRSSGLATNKSTIDSWVNQNYNASTTNGATPTIDGMQEARNRYAAATPASREFNKASYKVNGQDRNRKTVYILITDGAANTARWDYLSNNAKAALKLGWGSATPGGAYPVYDSYVWTDERNEPNGSFYSGQYYIARTEAYEAMLVGMEDIAAGMRANGGVGGSGASFVSAFWEDRPSLSTYNGGYGQGWNTTMFPTIVESLREMTGNNDDFFVTSNTNIQDFSNKLIKAFKSASEEIEDQINITSLKGTVPKSFDLYKKAGNEYVKVSAKPTSGIQDQVAHIDMENMEAGSYKIVYKLEETEFKSDSYTPDGITFAFEGQEYTIGTAEDGNMAVIPGNPRTDCDISINKVASNNQADYPNATEYKDLEFRRQEFYFDSSYIFTSKVQDAKTSLVIEDKVDDRLEILDVFLVAGNDNAKVDAVSSATPNNTLIASMNGTGGTPIISITNNLVRYSLPQKPATVGGITYPFGGYIGKNYVLVVKARIKATVTDEQISEMRNTLDPEDGRPIGIPNVAEIKLDGTSIYSNKARAVPPELVLPTISKQISSATGDTWLPQYLDVENKDDTFRYRVQLEMPNDTTGYRNLVISDTLDPTLEAVLGTNNENLTLTYGETTVDSSKYTTTYDTATGKLTVTINDTTGEVFTPMSNKTLNLVFSAKIKTGSDLASKYNSGNNRVEIPNVASFKLNAFETRTSNQVLAIPQIPSVQLTKVDTTNTGTKLAGAIFVLKNTTAGVNANDKTLTTNAEGIININSLAPGQTYTLTETQAPEGYILDTGNVWNITVNNQGEVSVTGPETSIDGINITAKNAKPVTPTPTKWVKGESGDFVQSTQANPLVLSKNDEVVTYQIRIPIGSTAGFNELKISDTFDEFIIPNTGNFRAFILEDENTSIGGSLNVNGREATYTISSGFEELNGKTLVLEFKATASQDLQEISGKYSDYKIPNGGAISINGGDTVSTNQVYIQPTSGSVTLSKTISDGSIEVPLTEGLQSTFDLYRVVGNIDPENAPEEDDVKVGTYTINGVSSGNASVVVSHLVPGTYYFVETSAPIGYSKTDGIAGGTFTISPDGGVQTTSNLSVNNEKTNDLTIGKMVKKQDGGTYSSEDYAIGIGEVWNYAIDIDVPNNPAAEEYTIIDDINRAFEIRSLSVLSGDNTSSLSVDNTARGFLAPFDYSNPNRVKMIIPADKVNDFENKIIRIELAVRVKPGTNLLEAGILTQDGKVPNTATLSFGDKSSSSTVNIVPTLLRSFSFTKKLGFNPLGGANFKLYHVDNDGGVGDPVYETFVTPQKQYSSISDYEGKVSFNNVPAGTYWMVEEIVPQGSYALHEKIKVVVKGANYQGDHPIEFQTEAGLPISATEVFNNTLVEISGKKVWNDDNNYDLRPEKIKVRLLRKIGENGTPEPVDSIEVTEPWEYEFKDEGNSKKYPKYNPLTNEEYIYYVEEDEVPFYSTEIEGTTITNTSEESSLRLIKRDGDTNLPIEGTTFVLEDINGQQVEVVSDENGAILFENVKKGVYYSLYEKKTEFSSKYIYNSGVVSLYINDDGNANFTPNRFPLVDPDGDPNTDNSGHVFLNYLKPVATKKVNGEDSYNLKSLNEEVEYSITVPVKGTGDIKKFEISDTVDNSMQIVPNSVRITKTVEGGTPEDITSNFNTELSNSNRTGRLWLDNLMGDTSILENSTITVTFKAKIILAPNNFMQMHPDKTVPNKAVLNINDLPENRQETNEVNIVADLTELSFTKKLEVQDGEPENLPAGVEARFRIEKISGDGVFVPRELVTDASGKVTILNLDVGEYLITETKVPEGYLPIEEIVIEVTKNSDGAFEYRAFGDNGRIINIENNILEDMVDPLPAKPTINKMAKAKDATMTAEGGDYKHYDMKTWKEEFDYVVDIKLPENIAGYKRLYFDDVLPIGIDIADFTRVISVVGDGEGVGFTPDGDQSPYSSISPIISNVISTRQYEVYFETEDATLINALAGKTIRITIPAKINDNITSTSQLTLINGNIENIASVQVNQDIFLESKATVKPVDQYGTVIKKIADFKNNGEDVPLANATFILSKHPEGPALPEGIRTDYTTGSDGLVTIDSRLEAGKYILTEAFFPNGYTDSEGNFRQATFVSDYYYFVLEVGAELTGGDKGIKLSGSLTPYGEEPELVEIYEGSGSETDPAKVINRKQLYIPVAKVWEDENNLNNTRPETITLTLQRAIVNGESDVLNPETGELMPVGSDSADTPDTDFNDRALTDPQLTIEIPIGSMPTYFSAYDLYRYTADGNLYNYYVIEEGIDGYRASYSVKPSDPAFGEDAPAETVVITNTLNTTEGFVLQKVDDSETPVALEGAVFNISYTNAAGQNITNTKTTDADGKINLDGLAPNKTYKLKEITAPDGYLIDDTEYTIVVDKDGEFKVYIIYVDEGSAENVIATNFDTDTKVLTVVDKKPEISEPIKKINGENSFNLPSLTTEFEYTVEVPVESVEGMTSFIIEDTVHDLLEIVPGSAVVKADGREVSGGTIAIDGKKITFTLNSGFNVIANRTVILSFKTKVASGVTMEQLNTFMENPENNSGIPNEATLKINDKSATSNTVYLVPGEAGSVPALDKKVNGLAHYDLVENNEVFKYVVKAEIPENVFGYDTLVIRDSLAKILQVEGGVVVRAVEYNADGTESSSQTLVAGTDYTLTNTTNTDPNAADDGNIIVEFSDYDFTKLAGKTIVVEFDSKIKTGVTPEQISSYNSSKIPNIAEIELNGTLGDTKTVTVAPTSDITIDKKVNGEDEITLNGDGLAGQINYTVEAKVPFNVKGYNTFVISDQLSEVLEYLGATITVDDGADTDGHIVINHENGLVTATITGNENITKYAGKTIKLTINTKIDNTKDLSDYLVEGKLPNTAEIKVNDQTKASDDANINVSTGSVKITKVLEGENSLWPTGEKAVFKLEKQVGTEWELVETIEIDGFSPVTIGNLAPGKYRLTETSAPAGYLLADPQEFTITASEDEDINLTFTDTKSPGISKSVDKVYFENFDTERTFTILVPITSVEGIEKIVISDEVDSMFQIVAGSTTASVNGTALSVQPVVSGQTITLTKTDNFEEIENKTITLTFKAKLKDGFVYSELPADYKANGIPNKAELVINNNPKAESEEVRVKVLVGEVVLTKTADGQPLPAGTSASFMLYSGTPEDGVEIREFTTAKNGADADFIYVGELAPGSYYFVETVAPQGYVLNSTPRKFTITVSSDGLIDVTPGENFTDFKVDNTKSEIPIPEKKVNGEESVELNTFDEIFNYTVSVPVTKVDGWSEFTLIDQVDASLLPSNIKVTIDGVEYTPGTIEGGEFTVENNLITFKFTQMDKIQGLVGKTVVLSFDAKINVTPQEFEAAHPDSIVRNKATLSVGNLSSTSNEVTVTPPGETPTPIKSINGDASTTPLKLGAKDQKFFYDIRVRIPSNVTGYEKLVLSDALEPVLETSVDRIKVYVNDINNEALKGYVSIDSNTVTLSIDNATLDPDFDFETLTGKTLRLEIEANFKSDVTAEQLAPYMTNGIATVANKAQLTINTQAPKESNTVNVTPPGDEPTVEKTVNNEEELLLNSKGQEFTYRVAVKVPANIEGYNNITIEDTLENVLEVVSTDVLVGTSTNPELVGKVTNNNNKVTLNITEDFATYAGKTITLVINAKIKDSVTLDQIAQRYGNSAIPNKVTLNFNGSSKTSNEVKVTPPSDIAAPVKTVNAQNDIVLGNITDEFVYNISYKIPTNITGFNTLVLTDELEEVLITNADNIVVYVDEQADNKLTEAVSISGTDKQTVSLTINKGFLGGIFGNAFEDLAGKTIRVEIKANIKDGADLSAYADNKVPNIASLKLNNKDAKESNTVTVQPPKGSVILTKVVDGEPLSGDQTATFKLYKQAGAEPNPTTDTLVQISGADEATVDATNNKLTVSGLEPGKYYFVETAAPEGYTLNSSPIPFEIKADQSIAVALTWNNVSDLTPVKTVNDAKSIEIKDFDQEFTYKVSVPVGPVSAVQKLVISDEVNALLSIVEDSAKAYKQDGTVVSGDIVVNGNKITFTKTSDFTNMTNSLVTLEFKAKLKDGITVTELQNGDILTTGIPNKGTLSVNDKTEVDSDTVYVKPVLGDVELVKTANNKPLESGQSAKFDLYKGTAPNGTKVGETLTTNADGKIVVTDLIPGSYYFVEVEAPAGYKLDTTPRAFTIYGGEKSGTNPVTVNVNNVIADIPTPTKTVNGASELKLNSMDQEFTYKIEVPVTDVNGINSFVISDEVDAFLTIKEDSVKVSIGADDVTGTVTVNGQNIVYTANEADITAMAGKTVTLEFKATIKEGTTAESLREVYENLRVPNKATLTINESTEKATNTVYVQPQFGGVVLTKTIDNGQPLPKDVTATFSLYRVTSTGDVLVKEYTTVNGRIEVYDLEPGNYKFVEDTAPAGYEKAADVEFTIVAGEATKQITVDNRPITTSINVEKKWVNGPETKPAVEVQLFRQVENGNREFVGEAVELNNTNDWKHNWTVLPTTNANGQSYTYSVDEINVPDGYGKEITGNATDGFVITNTFGITTGDITAYKKWVGGDSLDRPTDIYFQLVKDGANEGAPVQLTGTEVTWANMPLVNDDGSTIVYTVKEVKSDGTEWTNDDYTVSYDGLVVTNTYKVTKTDLTVRKDWVNGPESKPAVEVQLFRQVTGGNREFVGNAVTLNGSETTPWTHTWTNLDKTNANGQEYIYTVDEITVPEGYGKTITGNLADGFVITNTFGITTGDIKAYKKWVGGDSLERPTDIYFQLIINGVDVGNPKPLGTGTEVTWESMPLINQDGTPVIYTIREVNAEGTAWANENYEVSYDSLIAINTYKTSKTTATVEKVWSGGPADKPEVQVQLFRQITGGNKEFVGDAITLNGTETTAWTYTWTDLDKTNANGQEYTYTVDELNVPAGYSKVVSGNIEDGYVITNTFGINTGDIKAYKKWVGGDSLDRPTDIYFQLVKDGTDEGDPKVLGNSTEVTWSDMPLVKEDGTAIVYTVKEVKSDGTDWTNENYTVSYDGLVVTNTYQVAKTTATIEKVWDGGPATKPAVQVQLFRQVTGGNKEFVGDAITLDGSETTPWTHTWTGLDKTNANGQSYTYTVDEITAPAGYGKAITGNLADGFVITNTFGITAGDITAYKKWVGGDSLDRPTDIYFQLLKDGVDEGDAKVLGNSTEVTWANMPLVNEDGSTIVYTLKEVKSDGTDWTNDNYTVSYDGLVVTNTYKTETRSVYAKKIWSGGPVGSHVQPTFQLYRNGTLVDVSPTITPNADSSQYDFVWSELDTTDAYGQEYYYTVVETGSYDNYGKSAVSGDGKSAETAYTITNTYNSPTTTHSFTKTWVNGPTVKPTIEVQLYQNGTEFGNKVALANGSTNYEWTNLPTTDTSGDAYTYTVKELTVGEVTVESGKAGDYTVTEENNGTASTITNTYNIPKVTLNGQKTWVGDGASSRPDSITVELLRNGNPLDPAVTTTANAAGDWKYSFADLDSTDAEGNAYTYTVRETVVPTGYEESYNGMNITNTYVGTTSVEITKTWVDDSNSGSTRPTQITLIAIRNDGQRYEKVFDVSTGNNETYTIDNLPKFDADGNEYTYTVDEVAVNGYAKTIEGTTITNTLTGTIDIPFEKVWVGAPTVHPSITINLLADGTQVDSVTIDNGDSLTGVFENKPVFDSDGKKIDYTITEAIATDGDKYSTEIKLINGTWIITNTYGDKVNIPIAKSWQYADGSPMTNIPSEITRVFVVLYRNDESTDVVELTTENEWRGSFDNLQAFDENGIAYSYRVEELPVDGFEGSLTTNDDGSVSIVNKKKDTPTMSIPVQKLWNGEKPTDITSITVVLTRDINGAADTGFSKTLTLSGSDWKDEFTGLPREDADGNKYTYHITENAILGYEATYTGGEACGFVIFNSPTTGANFTFDKVIAGTETGLPGAEFELRGITNPSYSLKATSDSDGKVVFNNIPYGEYTLAETIAPEGYERNTTTWTITVERNGNITVAGNVSNGFKVENSILKGSVELTKTLEGRTPQTGQTAKFELYRAVGEIDNTNNGQTDDVLVGTYTTDQYGKIQVNNLEKGFYYFKEIEAPAGYILDTTPHVFNIDGTLNEKKEVTVNNIRESNSISVQKDWVGGPTDKPEVQVQLFRQIPGGNKEFVGEPVKLNTTNEWKYTWDNLTQTDGNGNPYTYTVDEINVPDGYGKEITGTGTTADPFVIKNTFGITTGDITAYKKWVGGDSLDRPTDIYFQLVKDGTDEGDPKALGTNTEVTWSDMPLVNTDGTAIVYTVKEVKSDGTDWTNENYTVSYDGLVVANTYKSSDSSISVQKDWKGGSDRPDVQVQLFRQITGGNKEFVGEPATLNTTNEWKYTWDNLTQTDGNGNPYTYTVDEINVPAGYSKKIEAVEGQTNSFKITNTFGVEKTDITVTKSWIGGPTPKPKIELELLRNIPGQEPQKVEGIDNAILQDGEISYTWPGLDVTDSNGNIYTYSVREVNVPEGYSVSYDGLRVTNTFSDTVGLQILKTDEQGNPLSGANFGLFDKYGTTLLKEETSLYDGKLVFTELVPGETYIIRETLAPEGYVISNERYTVNVDSAGIVEVIGNSGVLDSNPLVIKNKAYIAPEPEKVNVVVHKTWANLLPGDSADNHTATFKLDQTGDEKIIRGNGTVVFENLPKYDSESNIIKYTVTETPIDGFETITAGNMKDGFVFTNYPTAKFGVVLQKTDERTKAVLPGAEFKLYKKGANTGDSSGNSTTDSAATLDLLKSELELEKIKLSQLINQDETNLDTESKLRRIEEIERLLSETPVVSRPSSSIAPQIESLKSEAVSRIERLGIEIESKIAKLKSEIDEFNSTTTEEDKEKLESEIQSRELLISALELEKSTLDIQVEEIKAQFEDLYNKMSELDRQLGEVSNTDIEEPSTSIDRAALEEELRNLKSEINNNSKDSETKSLEIERTEARIAEIEKEISLLVESTIENSNGSLNSNDLSDVLSGATRGPIMGPNAVDVPVGEYITDGLGLIVVGDLEAGDYYFIEIKAPAGYTGDLEKKHEFSVPKEGTPSEPVVISVTNTLTKPETVEYTGHKVWIGGPEEKPTIKIQILQNGEKYGNSIELKNGETSFTWTNLPKYNGTEEYIYSIAEIDPPENYYVSINENIITNIWNKEPEAEYITIEGTKTWLNDSPQDRPQSIVVDLYKDGQFHESIEVRPDPTGEWKYSFGEQVLKETDGTIHVYYVIEKYVKGYEASYNGFNITNTRKEVVGPNPITGTISGQKTWRNDTENDRPLEILVYLIDSETGRVVDTQRVTRSNDWRYEFRNVLFRDSAGKEYRYRVEEEKVPNYKAIYIGYDIINEKEGGGNYPIDPIEPIEPEIPGVPETPTPPQTPETPKDPEKPVIPKDPEKPEVPEKPDKPEAPMVPKDPETPKPSKPTPEKVVDPIETNPKTLVEGYATHIIAMVLAAAVFVFADIKRRKNY